jgi:hypothetical protein
MDAYNLNDPINCEFSENISKYNPEIHTVNCDPNDKRLWFNTPPIPNIDPVQRNIYWGGWLCNYEEARVYNRKICERTFDNSHIKHPNSIAKRIELDNNMRNMQNKYNNKHSIISYKDIRINKTPK